MDDMIYRQAAIDVAKDWYDGLICGSFKGLEKRLKSLPSAQPEPQWTPCSERMPEENGEYLVCVSDWNKNIYIEVYEYCVSHNEWNDGDLCGLRVMAWMPLPEPYAERR